MKRVLIACSAALLSITTFAATLKSEEEAKRNAEEIMAQVAKGDMPAAFNLMKPYVVIPEAELQGMALQSKAQRDQYIGRYGKAIGYEFISEKKAGNSLLRFIYAEKTEKHALPWMFVYYKTPAGWVLNTFMWNDQISLLFTAN